MGLLLQADEVQEQKPDRRTTSAAEGQSGRHARVLAFDLDGSSRVLKVEHALCWLRIVPGAMGEAVIHRPGEGERQRAGGSSAIIIKASGDDTAGSLFLSETTIDPGFPGPPLHRHQRLHDMFYVLDGVLTMRLGDDTHELGPGTFVCVPPGIAHTFSNPSDAPVRFLNFNTPAGWEHYMRELGEAAASGPLTPDVIGRIASHYDFQAL